MNDARITGGLEDRQERPRGGAALKEKVEELRRAEREKKAKREAEQARGEQREISEIQSARWGMSHLNRKLLKVAEGLQARFDGDDVQELLNELEKNGDASIALAEGTSDEFIGAYSEKGNAGTEVPVSRMKPEDAKKAEESVIERYRTLASGTAPPGIKEKYFFPGAKKKAEVAAQAANKRELAQFKDAAEQYVPQQIEFVKRTLGFKQSNATLAQAGFQLEVVNEGPILKFVAVPMPEQLEKPAEGPKETYTQEELQKEIARALTEKQASEQASADAAELVRLKAADSELKDLKAKLPEMLEAAADKAVAKAIAQEKRVHDVIIAMNPNLPAEVIAKLRGPIANGPMN